MEFIKELFDNAESPFDAAMACAITAFLCLVVWEIFACAVAFVIAIGKPTFLGALAAVNGIGICLVAISAIIGVIVYRKVKKIEEDEENDPSRW